MGQLKITLNDQDLTRINAVKDYAAKHGLSPDGVKLGLQPLYKSDLATYPFTDMTVWQSAGAVTLPYGAPPPGPASLRIWSLPGSLTGLPDPQRRAVLPRLSVQIGTLNEATGAMDQAPSRYYGWGTRVEVGIKQIPSVPGSPSTATTYELMGVGQADVVLLERLLEALAAQPSGQFITDLTLLYPPSPTGDAREGLRSDGNDRVQMAITQVNLTTETRPDALMAAEAGVPYRTPGCFNTPYDFIKLLWECSITRSGGFYLYYYNTGTKAGFPGFAFNDKGEATLSLLVTYAAPPQAQDQNRAASYMTCVVTGDYVDPGRSVVFAQADPWQVKLSPGASDTLEHLAFQYYMNPTQLAEENGSQPLAAGKVLAVRGGLYEVGTVAPGGNLDAIAKYFGTTGDAIKAANPGITDWSQDQPLLTALRLPDLTVTVGAAPGGNTLDSLSQYYRVRAGALAADNQTLPGLFDTAAVLTVNGGPVVRSAIAPPGSLPVKVERNVPNPVPQDPTDPTYGQLYLEHMYSLLGYRVAQNTDFNASGMGLPMGPTTEVTGSAAARKVRRPVLLESGQAWAYKQTVPFYRFAQRAAARAEGLPDPALSPYAGVGEVLQLEYDWQDIFGNRLITALSDPTVDPKAPLNKPPTMIGYTDPLVGLGQWQGISSHYRVYQRENKQPCFAMAFSFDPSRFNPQPPQAVADDQTPVWQKAAEQAEVLYRRLWYQLQQKLGDAYAVSLAVETSLLTASSLPLPEAAATGLKAWLESIYQFVAARADGDQGYPVPTQLTWDFTVAITLDQVNPAQLFELTAAFVMTRPFDLVDADFRDTPEVYRAVTPLAPNQTQEGVTDDDDGTYSLRQFALDLEAALTAPGLYQIKVAQGVDRERLTHSRVESPTWAVRIGLSGDQAISYRILNPGDPKVYAPSPIFNTLQSRQGINIYDYTTGTPINFNQPSRQLNFTGVDLDVWSRQFLESVDRVLSPEFVTPAAIVGNQTSTDYLSQLLEQKKRVAGAFKKLVMPVLKDVTASQDELAAARNQLEQQMLMQLVNAYTTNAIVQFQVGVRAEIPDPGAEAAPRLYGSLVQNPVTEGDTATDVSLTSPKVTLATTTDDQPQLLTFLLNAKRGGATGRHVDLNLKYQPTHVEHEIGSLPGIVGYQASSWLSFVVPLDQTPGWLASLGTFAVPLVLRAFPTPPSLLSQSGKATVTAAGTDLGQLCLWDYGFVYGEEYHYQQDRTYFTVQFNVKDPGLRALPSTGRDLFSDLAEFITVGPAVEKDLVSILSAIDGSTTDPTAFKDADAALQSYIALAGNVASAWEYHVSSLREGTPQESTADIYPFYIEESETAVKGAPALLINVVGDPPPGVGVPVVIIAGCTTESQVVSQGYGYVFKKADGTYLTPEDGLVIPERAVVLPGLNILARQDAWSSARIVRNQFLMPDSTVETAEPFIYRTPDIRFAAPLHPVIDSVAPVEIATIGAPNPGTPVVRPLVKHLEALLKALFAQDPQTNQTIQLECVYSFQVNPGLDPVSLPVFLLPPTPIDVRTDVAVPEGGCSASDSGPMVCRLANAIQHWFDQTRPKPDGGVLTFDLTVMSDLTRQPMPLLRLRELNLELAYITPPMPVG